MIVGFVIVELFPHAVSSLFTKEEQLVALAVPGLRWVFAVYPFVGFQMVCATYFQSIGKPQKSIVLSMTRQMLFLVPLLLILPNHWGVTGVWTSMTISDFLSVLLAGFLLHGELKSQHKKYKPLK
jgi:Na+-driven multidrug efflux pump